VHFIPLHLQPYWRDAAGHAPADFPVATAEFERSVSLPIFSAMTDDDVARVVAATAEILG
jgi:dTDP-4-amino-4,6-dideoxygalactose transaminase